MTYKTVFAMLFDTISRELFFYTDDWRDQGDVFVNGKFFMVRDYDLHRRGFLTARQPYSLQEGRIVFIRSGSGNYSLDLVEHHLVAGDLLVFYGETLVEKHSHSDDFQFDAFTFESERSDGNGVNFVHMPLSEDGLSIVEQHFALIWKMIHDKEFPTESVNCLTKSLLSYVATHGAELMKAPATNRREELLRRFITLVSRHAKKERNVSFYANHLCIVSHYLNTQIKQLSGRTVMEWVNETAVKEVKVWLVYSDESMEQIAERMCFSSSSSLTKFFKRETGMTPREYRLKCV